MFGGPQQISASEAKYNRKEVKKEIRRFALVVLAINAGTTIFNHYYIYLFIGFLLAPYVIEYFSSK